MENIVACCGCICNECPYYQKECGGCPKIQGKPFWLEYTGEERCSIYRCCVEERNCPTAADAVNSRAAGMTSRTPPGRRRKTRQA